MAIRQSLLPFLVFTSCSALIAAEPIPRVFQSDGEVLVQARTLLRQGDPVISADVEALKAEADQVLGDGPYSVTDKQHPSPSDDPHDYVSAALYYWPNPETPDGLPYIRKDGEPSPESKQYDFEPLRAMSGNAYTLALASFFTGEEKYAARSALLLRVWFLDDKTKMNPNLNHAQFIKGVNTGRAIGIIDTMCLPDVIDAVGLLQGSSAWTSADQQSLEQWFRAYISWLREEGKERQPPATGNNLGSWYDAQVVSYSLFVGDEKVAKQFLEEAKLKRIATQINPDGRQRHELVRTKSFTYSASNLRALTLLADLAARVGVDLWHYRTADGRGLPVALDYLVPYAIGEKPWPHPQLGGVDGGALFISLSRAAVSFKEGNYQHAAEKLRGAPSVRARDRLAFLEN